MVDPTILGISRKTQLWHRWKALRNIPFRSKWFVGYDLEGNSYWEFKDHNNPNRLRRQIAHTRPHYEFGKFQPHPMWMQWMQHTRHTPPTLLDLVNDAKRLHRMKVLAQQADQKWKSIPLKSQMNTDDPRIGSAWSGQPTTNIAFEEERSGWSDSVAPTASQDPIRLALEHAESQNKAMPRVKRDELGQVTVERVAQKRVDKCS